MSRIDVVKHKSHLTDGDQWQREIKDRIHLI